MKKKPRKPLKTNHEIPYYIKEITDKAYAALTQNFTSAELAIDRANTYYNRPRYDRFTGMWDYYPDKIAKTRRCRKIQAAYTQRKG